MTSVSAGHIILTPTQPIGTVGPQLGSMPGPPHQELCALPTELPQSRREIEIRKESVRERVRREITKEET